MRYGMAIDLDRCLGCGACIVACKSHNNTPKGVNWSHLIFEEEGTYPSVSINMTPVLCMQCANPACVNVCPTGASWQGEDGIVHVDADRCIGCRYCIAACPYGARQFMTEKPQSYYPAKDDVFPYMEKQEELFALGVVTKCEFCSTRLDEGKEPACVATCPANARIFGDVSDPASEISMVVGMRAGRGLKAEEAGTDPQVFYLPR